MSASTLLLEDGRMNWPAVAQTAGQLALYGGVSQRRPENPVLAPEDAVPADPASEALTELRRGISETTGLFAEPGDPGWLAVTCDSKRMAAWMCAAVILENVDARCEDEILYVPASSGFEVDDEVMALIMAVAKAARYWQAQTQRSAAAQQVQQW
jgi:hypothetical protein